MLKITFLGAGSTVFARNVLGDVMCTPALRQCEIALYDIDGQRLKESEQILQTINRNANEGRAVIHSYLGEENRKDALRRATSASWSVRRWRKMRIWASKRLRFGRKHCSRPCSLTCASLCSTAR